MGVKLKEILPIAKNIGKVRLCKSVVLILNETEIVWSVVASQKASAPVNSRKASKIISSSIREAVKFGKNKLSR